jgi:hypothetical protein
MGAEALAILSTGIILLLALSLPGLLTAAHRGAERRRLVPIRIENRHARRVQRPGERDAPDELDPRSHWCVAMLWLRDLAGAWAICCAVGMIFSLAGAHSAPPARPLLFLLAAAVLVGTAAHLSSRTAPRRR